ncbi:hypothetical protein HAX54_022914, partial [Datura stramonium]|nr:hypothetical protein [Datura stramonium]
RRSKWETLEKLRHREDLIHGRHVPRVGPYSRSKNRHERNHCARWKYVYVAGTSSIEPFITVQLRAPPDHLTYQIPRFVLTTMISKKLDYNSKVVPWDYQGIKIKKNKHRNNSWNDQ